MRFEWGLMISERRWDLLEALARKDPSQQLCDTVQELILGLPDREDRRPLKRVLYVLRQKGFEPSDPDQAKPESPKDAHAVFAILASANRHGYTTLVYAARDGLKVRQMFASVNDRWRFLRVRMVNYPHGKAQWAKEEVLSTYPAPLVECVDAGYVLFRIARRVADQKNGELYRPNGFWRRLLGEASEPEHPTTRIPSVRLDSAARLEHLRAHPVVSTWRLAIHPSEEVWSELLAARWSEEGDKAAILEGVLLENRASLASKEAIAEHSERLRDLAYLEHVRGEEGSGRTLAVALDLEARGGASDYFAQLLRWTASDLDLEIEEDEYDMPPPGATELPA